MRWRTEQEVRSGKGQFECGDKRCSCRNDLTSWEVGKLYLLVYEIIFKKLLSSLCNINGK